jgi:hypothetical protein
LFSVKGKIIIALSIKERVPDLRTGSIVIDCDGFDKMLPFR